VGLPPAAGKRLVMATFKGMAPAAIVTASNWFVPAGRPRVVEIAAEAKLDKPPVAAELSIALEAQYRTIEES
jgi:hypothetical protein